MKRPHRNLTALLACSLIFTGCAATSSGDNSDANDGDTSKDQVFFRPLSNESSTTVYEDWMSAILGTMGATGRDTYISEGGLDFPGESRVLDDFLPGFPCSEAVRGRIDPTHLSLFVSTYDQDLGYAELDEPLGKVAAYWESRGWEPKLSGGGSEIRGSISTTTDHGTYIQYTASAGGEDIEAKSPCSYGFNPDYEPPAEDG